MALSARQRQKRAERKNKKRKLIKKRLSGLALLTNNMASYSKYPVHECLIPSDLFETGIGTILVSKKKNQDNVAFAVFLVDIFCLGVKNALFNVVSEYEYENEVIPKIMRAQDDRAYENIHASCAKKLIVGSVDYASDLGFLPHRDYRKYIGILNNVDVDACPVTYTYGKGGKPFYVQGPNETRADMDRILKKLQDKCGDYNYDYLLVMDEGETINIMKE